MCDGTESRAALYVFMISGAMSPLVAIIGAKLWPKRAMAVGLVSLSLFLVAGVAAAFVTMSRC